MKDMMTRQEIQNRLHYVSFLPPTAFLVRASTTHGSTRFSCLFRFPGEAFCFNVLDGYTAFMMVNARWSSYDYADLRVAMLDRMFQRRKRGYHAIGYEIASLSGIDDPSLGTITLPPPNDRLCPDRYVE